MIRNLTIRPAKLSDSAFVEKCYSDLIKVCLFADKPPKIPNFYETWKYTVEDPVHFPTFICEDEGKPVGVAQCNVIQTLDYGCTSLNITDLVVDRNIRAKGVGTCLMNYVKEYAKKRGIRSVELVTPKPGTEKSEERHQFYKRHGFHQYGPAMILSVDPNLLDILENE